jgi:hypothetical protein
VTTIGQWSVSVGQTVRTVGLCMAQQHQLTLTFCGTGQRAHVLSLP